MNTPVYGNCIGGSAIPAASGRTYAVQNPAHLSDTVGEYPDSDETDVEAAVAAAQRAFPLWRQTSPYRRGELLAAGLAAFRRRRDDLVRAVTLENGKTLREAGEEVDRSLEEMEFQIAEGARIFGETHPSRLDGMFTYTQREPLGVVGLIAPWNFPFSVAVRKGIPALVAGNTCVLKPASLTPRIGLLFTEILADSLPSGVLNCITGKGRIVGSALVRDPRVRGISFTGSTEVGIGIQEQAARTLTRTQLELGGKNPAVVLEDADLDLAVGEIVKGAFSCSGQWCTSTSRVVVDRRIAPELTARLAAAIGRIRVGDGLCEDTTMGPVCGTVQKARILDYIAIGLKEGARIVAGGMALTGPDCEDGCFIAPTLFDGVAPDMRVARDEIFGPVLVLLEAQGFDDAVAIANDTSYGLASSLFTRDLARAMTFLERSDVGMAHVNCMTALRETHHSFGGVEHSGFGLPESGKTGIEFFTKHKIAYLRYR